MNGVAGVLPKLKGGPILAPGSAPDALGLSGPRFGELLAALLQVLLGPRELRPGSSTPSTEESGAGTPAPTGPAPLPSPVGPTLPVLSARPVPPILSLAPTPDPAPPGGKTPRPTAAEEPGRPPRAGPDGKVASAPQPRWSTTADVTFARGHRTPPPDAPVLSGGVTAPAPQPSRRLAAADVAFALTDRTRPPDVSASPGSPDSRATPAPEIAPLLPPAEPGGLRPFQAEGPDGPVPAAVGHGLRPAPADGFGVPGTFGGEVRPPASSPLPAGGFGGSGAFGADPIVAAAKLVLAGPASGPRPAVFWVTLEPPELGRVEVRLRLRPGDGGVAGGPGGALEVELRPQTPAAFAALAGTLDGLKETLSSRGVILAGLSLFDPGGAAEGGSRGGSFAGRRPAPARTAAGAAVAESRPTAAGPGGPGQTGRFIDRKV